MKTTPLLTPRRLDVGHLVDPLNLIAAASLIVSLVVGLRVDHSTLWGFLPIGLYGVLAACGMRVLLATLVSVLSALFILLPGPQMAVDMVRESAVDQVTIIGVVILLGGGLAEILRATGAATKIVTGTMRFAGTSTTSVALGIMLTCLVLVTALGTLAGALAVAVPVLLPVAARAGLTRSATASAVFIGGCAGYAIAPFAPTNIVIMRATDMGYVGYMLHGAGPLMVLSIVVGMVAVPWMQRRTVDRDDHYSADELGAIPVDDIADDRRATRAAVTFVVALLLVVVGAAFTSAGIMLPLIALPALAIVTGLSAGMSPRQIATVGYRGAAGLAWLFVLFCMLSILFNAINRIDPFTVVLGSYGSGIKDMAPFAFAMTVALIGWVGVPGASAAQVVLLDKIFGDIAAATGIGAGVWVVVLLFSSKADTYGPLPNVNMLGVMGLCRSINVRNILITGWCVLLPAIIMYTLLIYVGTH